MNPRRPQTIPLRSNLLLALSHHISPLSPHLKGFWLWLLLLAIHWARQRARTGIHDATEELQDRPNTSRDRQHYIYNVNLESSINFYMKKPRGYP